MEHLAPSPASSPAPAALGWIDEVRQGLREGAAGTMILIDKAVPETLGPLVRALYADHPEVDVLASAADLERAKDGSVIILLPEAEGADRLKLHRSLIARKALKVALFCGRDSAEALARRAPDFYGWFSSKHEHPNDVEERAAAGIRKALLARAPGVAYVIDHGDRPARARRVERVFRKALPGRSLRWIDPSRMTYEMLVEQITSAGRAWVACDAWGLDVTERFRWALAEAKRRTRAILVMSEAREDRFWFVKDAPWGSLDNSIKLLERAGAKRPGRLVAVAGVESAATIAALNELLTRGQDEDALFAAMIRDPDPGAGLSEIIKSAGIEQPSGGAPPLRGGHADRIEALLCRGVRTAELWIDLAHLALVLGEEDIAATWASRSLAMQRSPEVNRFQAMARDLSMRVRPETLLVRELLARGEPQKALDLADAGLAKPTPWRPGIDGRAVFRMPMLALALNRVGRASDAEVVLRKLLGLPVDMDTSGVGAGLASRDTVRDFLDSAPMELRMADAMRDDLWDELLRSLRAQGRLEDATELECRRAAPGA